MVRVSYGLAPAYPAARSVELVAAAEARGLHGCYLGDDWSLHDPWVLAGAAAARTSSIRLGFSTTHVVVRDPLLVAQALATLDDLSGGRVETAVALGGPATFDAFHVGTLTGQPIARLREAIAVMRQFLDEGAIEQHEGRFYRYSGVSTLARPAQDRVPLLIAAMVGPRSFELAGEVADGVHAAGCSQAYSRFVVDRVATGAARTGRDVADLDVASFCIVAVADEEAPARAAARALVAGWLPTLPRKLIARHGIDPATIDPAIEAFSGGDGIRAAELTPAAVVDALCIAGTPEQCVERIRCDLVEPGIDHVIMGIADPVLAQGVSGTVLDDVPGVVEQLDLIGDRVLPALSAA